MKMDEFDLTAFSFYYRISIIILVFVFFFFFSKQRKFFTSKQRKLRLVTINKRRVSKPQSKSIYIYIDFD